MDTIGYFIRSYTPLNPFRMNTKSSHGIVLHLLKCKVTPRRPVTRFSARSRRYSAGTRGIRQLRCLPNKTKEILFIS